MLLAIDVGNTNIVLGVFDRGRLAHSWRLQTLRERTADEVGILVTQLFGQSGVDRSRIKGIILSSVVPPLTGTMQEMAERYFGQVPLTVGRRTDDHQTLDETTSSASIMKFSATPESMNSAAPPTNSTKPAMAARSLMLDPRTSPAGAAAVRR